MPSEAKFSCYSLQQKTTTGISQSPPFALFPGCLIATAPLLMPILIQFFVQASFNFLIAEIKFPGIVPGPLTLLVIILAAPLPFLIGIQVFPPAPAQILENHIA
ncbi:hypothetical protein HMPREF0322_02011 [Desulfitobacterium hafniense DP7]|uniref:Uncharacterized protein n=1 Tax=Desulfitobacterium hafniense DP7 TaxID=537010 RepID=G9XM25_DESHA|nr:hypothetical protein HMPREF0322_02011 [Desulfitobacterium hafniense DP7]